MTTTHTQRALGRMACWGALGLALALAVPASPAQARLRDRLAAHDATPDTAPFTAPITAPGDQDFTLQHRGAARLTATAIRALLGIPATP